MCAGEVAWDKVVAALKAPASKEFEGLKQVRSCFCMSGRLIVSYQTVAGSASTIFVVVTRLLCCKQAQEHSYGTSAISMAAPDENLTTANAPSDLCISDPVFLAACRRSSTQMARAPSAWRRPMRRATWSRTSSPAASPAPKTSTSRSVLSIQVDWK